MQDSKEISWASTYDDESTMESSPANHEQAANDNVANDKPQDPASIGLISNPCKECGVPQIDRFSGHGRSCSKHDSKNCKICSDIK